MTTHAAGFRPVTRSGSSTKSCSPGETRRRRYVEVLDRLADDAELVTCLRGPGAPLDDDAVRGLVDGRVELELEVGGQQSYWWLLSAE